MVVWENDNAYFEDGEEALLQNILSIAGTKARVYDTGFQDRCTLAFHGLVIDGLQHGLFTQKRSGVRDICFVGE